MQLGTVWLVRIGVVMVLTALVFGTRLAYNHYIVDLPAGGKVALWYLLSAVLGGAGLWLERLSDSTKNYGRVLAGGGLAAVYYTTYAIHHTERLRIVESPLLGGILLLACALGILGIAAWRRSSTIAIVAVAMAYYVVVISPLGWFALFSNLLLTAVGIAIFLRFRWASLGWVCLGATYGAFAFWQLIYGQVDTASQPGFAAEISFLTGYWLLFTSAVFLPRRESQADTARTRLAQLNNGLFFALGTMLVLRHDDAQFWLFSAAFGLTLIGLSRLPLQRGVRHLHDAYLAVGITLAAIGATAKLDGYQLVLTLAAAGVGLQLSAARTGADRPITRIILNIASLTISSFGVLISVFEFAGNGSPIPWPVGLLHGAITLGQAHLATRSKSPRAATIATGLAGLALVAWGVGALSHLDSVWVPPVGIASAALLALASRWNPARLPRLGVLGLGYAALGAACFIAGPLDAHAELAASIALTSGLGLVAIWQFVMPRPTPVPGDRRLLTAVALGWAAMLATFTDRHLHDPQAWQWMGGGLALALFALGAAVGTWRLAAIGHAFAWLGALSAFGDGSPGASPLKLVPIAALIACSLLTHFALRRSGTLFFRGADRGTRDGLLGPAATVGLVNQIGAAALFVVFVFRHYSETASLSIGIAAFVTFAVGILANLRTARRIALGLLGITLLRVVFADVWDLPAVPRFITFLVLGIVLLALGFVYNRYQEKIRRFI